MEQHAAGAEVLEADRGEGGRGSAECGWRAFGQDLGAGFQRADFKQPVERREVPPDLFGFGGRVAQLEGGILQAEWRGADGEAARDIGGQFGVGGQRSDFDGQERGDVGIVLVEPGQESRPGDERDSPALLRHERADVLPHAARQQPRIDVADDDHVVLEQFVAVDRETSECRFVLLGVFGVGVLQISGELDRAVALQQRFQEAKFVIRIALDQQDADLVVADGDRALLAIVLLVGFVVAESDFDDVRDVAGFRRSIDEPQRFEFCRRPAA